jgi:hypothetical protein
MNLCLKTGADVWIASHQCIVHCDAYIVPTDPDRAVSEFVYVFRHMGERSFNYNPASFSSECHFLLADSDTFDQQACLWLDTADVIIAPMTCVINQLNERTGEVA